MTDARTKLARLREALDDVYLDPELDAETGRVQGWAAAFLAKAEAAIKASTRTRELPTVPGFYFVFHQNGNWRVVELADYGKGLLVWETGDGTGRPTSEYDKLGARHEWQGPITPREDT